MSIAMLGHFGLKEETSYGVEATPPTVFGEILSESIALDSGLIVPRYIGGVRGVKRVLPGPIAGKGDFKFDLTPEDLMGWVLKGIFGAPVTSTLAPGIYQHVFTPQDSFALPSFTVQVNAEAGTWNWPGTRFSDLNISMSPDKLLEAAITVIAQRVKEATAAVPSYTTLDPFTAYDVYCEFNGVQNSTFESLDFTITNGLNEVRTLNNQRYAGNASATTFDTTGNFTLEFSDMDMLRLFWGSAIATEPLKCLTASTLELDIVKSCPEGEIVPSSGVYYELKFEWPKVYISALPINLTSADDRIMANASFVTKYDAVAGYQVRATLVNSQASYA